MKLVLALSIPGRGVAQRIVPILSFYVGTSRSCYENVFLGKNVS